MTRQCAEATPALRVISCFAGIGGFDLGFAAAGMEVVAQIENDPACNRVLAAHYPGVPRWGDIKEVDPIELPEADLICGGFPCQDVSVAGRRAGLAGARTGLFWEWLRIVAAKRPRWVVLENVPGLLSSNGGRDMGAILWALGELGYGWAYRCLNAEHAGLAQRRLRVFIVGSLGSPASAVQVLLKPESCSGNSSPGRKAGTVVAGLTTSSIGSSGADDNQARAGHLVEVGAVTAACYDVQSGQHVEVSPTLDTRAQDGPWRNQCGVMVVEVEVGEAQTTSVRRLTPREYERLQGFCDDWTQVPDHRGRPMADGPRYRMLGNAVAVPVAQWLGARLVAQHRRQEDGRDMP